MKKTYIRLSAILTNSILILLLLHGCKKTENPIKFTHGTFPDSVFNMTGINSQYDDYNSNLFILDNAIPIIFSSNRGSNGGQFDLVQGIIRFQFDQSNGFFDISAEISNDPFYSALTNKANTTGNDFGPYSLFSSNDGFEYFIVASETPLGKLDLFYMKYLPFFGSIPAIAGPYPISKLNTDENEAYITFDSNMDSVYFCSDISGDFDIYLQARAANNNLDEWFKEGYAASVLADSINSDYDEKCPFIHKNIMVFASDRPGGMGGFDIYYSVFKNGKWNSPVNMGPSVNSASDEYRPLLGGHPDYTNGFLVFSSDRPGGSGGFDLYFAGFTLD